MIGLQQVSKFNITKKQLKMMMESRNVQGFITFHFTTLFSMKMIKFSWQHVFPTLQLILPIDSSNFKQSSHLKSSSFRRKLSALRSVVRKLNIWLLNPSRIQIDKDQKSSSSWIPAVIPVKPLPHGSLMACCNLWLVILQCINGWWRQMPASGLSLCWTKMESSWATTEPE